MMKSNENYQQQQITGKGQTVIMDPALTAETDELNSLSPGSVPPVDPEEQDTEDDDFEEDTDDEFPTREDLGEDEDDPGLNHDQDDDLSLNIDEDKLY